MPETIGILVLSAIGLAEWASVTIPVLGISVATAVGSGLLITASILLQLSQRPSLPKPGDGHQSTRLTTPSRIGLYGRARVAGSFMLYETGPDAKSYDVQALVSGKVSGFKTHYFHDDIVVPGDDGYIDSAPETPPNEFRYGSGDTVVRILTRLGTPSQTAFSEITTVMPTIWTADHRLDGTACAALICNSVGSEHFQRTYPRGLPAYSAAIDGYPLWDPRDAAQSATDPATWVNYSAWSDATTYAAGARRLYGGVVYISRVNGNVGNIPDESPAHWINVWANPVLQLIDYLTHADHGMALDRAALIDPVVDDLMVEADICDELVQKKNLDYEPRYTSNGFFLFDTDPEQVLASILGACDGWMIVDGAGQLALQVGKYRAPGDAVLQDRHIVGFSAQFGVADERMVNEMTMTFTSPAHKYKEVPGQSWRDEADISARGRTRTQSMPLLWVHYHPQARRLMKRAFERANPLATGKVVTTLYGLSVLGKRWVGLQYSLVASFSDVVIEITRAEIDIMAGRVTFDWVLINPNSIDDWDAQTEEGTPPPLPDDVESDSLPVPQDIQASAFGAPPFHIDISWDAETRTDLSWVVRYRLFDDGTGNPGPWSDQRFWNLEAVDGRLMASIFPSTEAAYVLEVASVGPRGTFSDWSDSVIVTLDASALIDNGGTVITDNAGVYVSDNS